MTLTRGRPSGPARTSGRRQQLQGCREGGKPRRRGAHSAAALGARPGVACLGRALVKGARDDWSTQRYRVRLQGGQWEVVPLPSPWQQSGRNRSGHPPISLQILGPLEQPQKARLTPAAPPRARASFARRRHASRPVAGTDGLRQRRWCLLARSSCRNPARPQSPTVRARCAAAGRLAPLPYTAAVFLHSTKRFVPVLQLTRLLPPPPAAAGGWQ